MRPVWRYTALFLLWTVLGLFFFSQGLAQKLLSLDQHPWWHHLTSWMAGVWLWFLLTPFVLWLGRRFPPGHRPYWRNIVIHLPISFLLPFADLAVEAAILRALHVFPDIMRTFPAAFIFL